MDALDACIFLAVNGGTRPLWMDRAAHLLAVITNGGWFWILGALVLHAFRFPRAGRALRVLVPTVIATSWLVEQPIKSSFRRRRPFIAIIRTAVVGKKPGSWSFPSGHTATAFAGAWVCSTVCPRGAPVFFAIASAIGFSRVYVGAHYPGDVLAGALFGTSLAELIRRLTLFVSRWLRA
jgi:undecaprenyl-diphosphatase